MWLLCKGLVKLGEQNIRDLALGLQKFEKGFLKLFSICKTWSKTTLNPFYKEDKQARFKIIQTLKWG